MSAETPTEHPHIVRQPGTCGGAPIIRGTRIPVWLVAALWKEGDTAEDMVRSYPHLQTAWVYDALSYYLDHQQEIDRQIEDNRIENVLAQHGGVRDEQGKVRFPDQDGTDAR